MPQATVKSGPQLGIRLDRTDHTYVPGETLIGHVFRQSHIVTPQATIRISLHARSKSRMVVNRGHITSTYRGRFDLVKSADYTQTIFQGPLHIAADGEEQRWSFALNLPTHVDLSASRSDATQDQSYLSLLAADALTYRLPPTFLMERYQYLSGMSAFVEYFLQAELEISSRGFANVTDAVLPFKLLHVNLELLNLGPSLQISHHTHSISSYGLVARQTNESTAHHMGKEPHLALDIQVHLPTALRINSPDPLPFSVLAIPDLRKSSDNVRYSSQEICVTHIAMHIVAKTEVKCRFRKTARQTDIDTHIDLCAEDAYRQYGDTLFVPWGRPAIEGPTLQEDGRVTETEPSEPLNVGEKIGLRLERRQDLFATFQTQNVQHTHRLKWKMTVQIAEKNVELSGEDAVKILTSPELERSIEWIRPPSEDQLPSFSVHQEDLTEADAERTAQDNASRSGGVGGLSRLWVL